MSIAAPTLPTQGLVRRNDAVNSSLLFDGGAVNSGLVAAASTTGANTSDFGFGGPGIFNTSRSAGGSLGAYLDDTEALAFYNAWHDYMVALGADT